MAESGPEPILVMLPDRSIRLFDHSSDVPLSVADILCEYPGHALTKFADSRRPPLDKQTPLKPGATYHLMVRRPPSVQPLADLDADVTLCSVPSTPGSTCSSRADTCWSAASPASSWSGHAATPHTPTRPESLLKSSSLKSEEEDCCWTYQASATDERFQFSMPFPPKPTRTTKPACGSLPRIPRPPVSPSPRTTHPLLRELQELERAEKPSSSKPKNPILAELDELEVESEHVFVRSLTAGHCAGPTAASLSRRSTHYEAESISAEIEAVKAELKQLALLSQSGEDKIVAGKRREASTKQPKAGTPGVLGKLGGFRAFGRRRLSSAPLVTLEESKERERNSLPTCMDLGIICRHEETEVSWDWNPRADMFYSRKM